LDWTYFLAFYYKLKLTYKLFFYQPTGLLSLAQFLQARDSKRKDYFDNIFYYGLDRLKFLSITKKHYQ